MNNIDETHEVVVSKIKDYVNSLIADNFVFGNIAFSKNGENSINIGSKLDLGESYKHNKQLQESLEKENARFGESLNALDSFSISKYLQMANLKCFELCLNGSNKKLVLHNFDINIKPIDVVLEKGLFSFVGQNQSIVPHYTDDYKPHAEGMHDASVAFNHTIDFYTQFHKLVINTPKDEGYIYLIRPSVIDNAFSALAYMYLKSALCKKDIEIISYYLSNYFLELLKDKAYKESIKSAKAAIMSRNMSHNLGSHVMAYVKNDLRNIPSIFASDVLYDLFPQNFSGDISTIRNQVELPFLVGLGSFIGYLQERQDYIATIASSYIPSFSPVNFKDAIYDELNPDLRFERHHQTDKQNHNRPQNILLSYIAKSEKLSRKTTKEGKSHNILIGFKNKDDIFWGLTADGKEHGLSYLRKFNIALPGGMVGRQAVFSIVENLIRNAAKHNNVVNNLELIFECIDGKELKLSPDSFSESINDSNLRNQYKEANDTQHLYILSITDNLPCSEPTVKKLKEALSQNYLGKDEHSNKGIKEIRISATWLRGEEDESVFAPCPPCGLQGWSPVENVKAPVVAIEMTTEGHLRYFIGLRRTYEFALVYSDTDNESDINNFRSKFSLSKDSYELLKASEIKESDTCYEYIIAENITVYKEIRSRVTNRCINMESIQKESGIVPNDIYSTYTGIEKESKDYIYILDDKTGFIDYGERIKMVDLTKALYPNLNEKAGPFNSIIGNGVKYLYRSHHFSESDYAAYWKDKAAVLCHSKEIDKENYDKISSQVKCIDAITGDNSSDRLVRREKLNEKWYYNHLYALKSQVAIFDERLFQIIHGIDEDQLVCGSFLAWSMKESCIKGEWPKELLDDDILDQIANDLTINKLTKRIEFKRLFKDCVNNEKSEENRKKLVEFLSRYEFRVKEDVIGSNHLTAAYKEKGVDIFTIIPAGHNLCYIVGCEQYEYNTETVIKIEGGREKEVSQPHYSFNFIPIALLINNPESEIISCQVNTSQALRYRYITIHQGLIDKIYEEFDLKDKNDVFKKKVLAEIYEKFTGEKVTDGIKDNKSSELSYLERLSIHSGRGNITKKEMPLEQPFLQYSAIEHAVLDCKYSLVELLDYAKFKDDTKEI